MKVHRAPSPPVAAPHKPVLLAPLAWLHSRVRTGAHPDYCDPTPSPPTPPTPPPPLYINAKNRKKGVSEGYPFKPFLIGQSHRQPDRPLFFGTG